MPPFWRVSEESACWNLWKIFARNASGIPGPRSVTVIRTRPRAASRDSETVTVSPRGENLIALETRFVTTCPSRSRSARIQTSEPYGTNSSLTP